MKLLITLLITSISFGQVTIVDANKKIVRLEINENEVSKELKKLPKGTYYIQRWIYGRVQECRIINKNIKIKK